MQTTRNWPCLPDEMTLRRLTQLNEFRSLDLVDPPGTSQKFSNSNVLVQKFLVKTTDYDEIYEMF